MVLNIFNLLNKVCPDWLEYEEPETLSIILKQHDIEMTDIVFNIINALKSCCLVETPWINPYIFENTVDAFNENIGIPETLTKPPLEEILYTVYIMMHIRNIAFSDDIAKFAQNF